MQIVKSLYSSVCLIALAFTGACGSDDSSSPGGGGTATGGSSGSGGGSSGSGGASGGTSGSGGATGGSAGATGGSAGASGGSAGASGGAGGAGGSGGVQLCGCTEATAADMTAVSQVAISFQCCSYTPPCIKIKAGSKVAWSGSFLSHPLSPFKTLGTQPNPILETNSGGAAEFTFTTPGAYGYFCQFHGGESPASGGMCGGIFVVP